MPPSLKLKFSSKQSTTRSSSNYGTSNYLLKERQSRWTLTSSPMFKYLNWKPSIDQLSSLQNVVFPVPGVPVTSTFGILRRSIYIRFNNKISYKRWQNSNNSSLKTFLPADERAYFCSKSRKRTSTSKSAVIWSLTKTSKI